MRGEARFVGPREIVVALKAGGERRLSAQTIVINTGESPTVAEDYGARKRAVSGQREPDGTGRGARTPADSGVLGSFEAVEFGQMFRRFGSAVTLIQRGKHLLDREDVDISEAVEAILHEDGLTIRTEAHVNRVGGKAGAITVHLEDGKAFMLRFASFCCRGAFAEY